MLAALQYGATPQGGIAPGIDRIVTLLCGEENMREAVGGHAEAASLACLMRRLSCGAAAAGMGPSRG
jgi:aspartyl-tRNA synthetase